MRQSYYISLIRGFLSDSITIADFERRFLERFKQESGVLTETEYHALDGLFWAVDSYDPMCMNGDETPFRITEQTLRNEAQTVLQLLESEAISP
jgi:hypothetical protein